MLQLIPLLVALQPTPPLAAEAMAAVSAERAKASVVTLASFGTRHTLSETESDTRGTGAARRWLLGQLKEAGVDAHLETFDAPPMQRLPEGAQIVNVVGVIPGSMPEAADRRYYVVGHYDTINADRMDATGDAPGANDDASGTAVVLECARALVGRNLESTIVFLCTGAEEQGLVGARFHAEAARGRGENISGVLSNDIVGDPSPLLTIPADPRGDDWVSQSATNMVRVFSEGIPRNATAAELATIRQLGTESDSASRQLARYVLTIAMKEDAPVKPLVIFRQDRFLRGGDHSAFNDSGFAAIRFSTPAEDYSRQHQNVTEKDGKPYGDVPEFVDGEYVANVARLNVAALVHLANAPRAPRDVRMITAELTTSTTVRWSPSPEPDVVGYDLVWRPTTSWQWEGSKDCGDVREFTVPISKDNFIFGVRAYDKDGYRSPVAVAGAAPK
ncbi:MAG: M20/M25/M40 family metallo-hydrolase [Leptolyngbya sp. PLA1]|nr:M20/M25/M40 family metallo-hydrolase [Leptolyngbya sp. PLA1]